MLNQVAAKITSSTYLQVLITLLLYLVYATVFGICVGPSLHIVARGFERFGPFPAPVLRNYFYFGFYCGLGLFLFYIVSVFVLGTLMRLSSWGIKPGRYSVRTFTVIRWLVHSGFYGMAATMVLPMIRVTAFVNLFYRLAGCTIGKNVRLNTGSLVDAYLLTIEDNVVIGGESAVSCHLVEHNHLILQPVRIGANTLIGARCYIPPGVTIGKNCVIGLYSYLRKGTTIPDNSIITSLAGITTKKAWEIEKGLERFYVRKGNGQN